MTTILTRMMIAMAALAGVMGLNAGIASATTHHTAAPAATQAHGQCGGPSTNMNQLIGNLMSKGVLDDIGREFNIRPVDDSVESWIRRNVGLATMARTATFGNKGCSHATFFGAHPRTLKPGDKAWVLTAELKTKFPNGFSLTSRKGWQRKVVCVKVFDNPTCTNPLTGEACIWVWVPPAKKTTPPTQVVTPKAPPGSCNIMISGSNITIIGNVTACSNFTTTVTCGNLSQTFTGPNQSTVTNQATTWQQANCTTPAPPPVIVTPPPVQLCQTPGATNIGGSLPCLFPPPCQPAVSVTTLNDLNAGGNSPNFRVTVTMCGNDSGTLNVSSQFGSVPGGSPVSVSGLNTYTFTYYAPGEVPPGGQDWVTATVRDNVTGSTATTSTPKFNIEPPPPST